MRKKSKTETIIETLSGVDFKRIDVVLNQATQEAVRRQERLELKLLRKLTEGKR